MVMDSSLNFSDKCEDHFSLSSEDFSACKTYLIYKMRGGPQGWSMDRVHEGVHGPGPQGWSIDLGSMFCIRPALSAPGHLPP